MMTGHVILWRATLLGPKPAVRMRAPRPAHRLGRLLRWLLGFGR